MAATHSSNTKMKTMVPCRRPDPQLTKQPSNLSNYEGYHGCETASVPFTWESRPGAPKHQFRETTLPPLTPPPSYYSYTASSSSTPTSTVKAYKIKNSSVSKSSVWQSILPKRATRKSSGGAPPLPTSPPANSSLPLSFSSSYSSSSSSHQSWKRSRSVPSTPRRSPRKEKEDDEYPYDAPGSGICFGNAGFRGCYSSMIKKVMLGDFL